MEAGAQYLLVASIILCLIGISWVMFTMKRRRMVITTTIKDAELRGTQNNEKMSDFIVPLEKNKKQSINTVTSQPPVMRPINEELEPAVQNAEVDLNKLETAFYDAMFNDQHTDVELNSIEEKALSNVREILNSPQKLSKQIPALPVVLLQLIDILKDPNSTFIAITAIIEKDPALAVEVIKVANSSIYYRADGEISSLRNAISLLGIAGISSIATTILMKKIKPKNPIYYKMFVDKFGFILSSALIYVKY